MLSHQIRNQQVSLYSLDTTNRCRQETLKRCILRMLVRISLSNVSDTRTPLLSVSSWCHNDTRFGEIRSGVSRVLWWFLQQLACGSESMCLFIWGCVNPFMTCISTLQVSSGPVILLKITKEWRINSQTIWKEGGGGSTY